MCSGGGEGRGGEGGGGGWGRGSGVYIEMKEKEYKNIQKEHAIFPYFSYVWISKRFISLEITTKVSYMYKM